MPRNPQMLVIGHAQIGGIRSEEFLRNNITATERLLQAAQEHGVGYIVHISSSVVNSMAVDHYTVRRKRRKHSSLRAASSMSFCGQR